jgi:multidrug efflux pump subunit AcrA (membrane-fusion protein)
MRRALLIVVILAVVALAVAWVGPRLLNRSTTELEPTSLGEASTQEGQTYVMVRGTVVPAHWAQLSFAMSGQLAEIGVTTGVTVSAGQVLASLEQRELELNVDLARSELAAQEASLATLQSGASEAEIAAAQASYDAALAAYEKLKAGPTAQEIAIAEADLKMAERAVQQAQAAYDAVRNRPDIGARPEAAQLEQATIEYQKARAAYELAIAGPDRAALKAAESQVASARSQLETLRAGARPSEMQLAQANVSRTQAGLAGAHLALEQAALRAPFAGVVTSLTTARAGDVVNAGTTIATVADLTQLQVEIADLDEWGAANITMNQSVDLVVGALNNRTVRGRLSFVSQEPTYSDSGAVFYRAIVALEKQDPDLRWGMTVRARLVLPRRAGGR